MKRLYISLLAVVLSATFAIAQVGGGIYNPSSSSGGGSVPATSITGVSAYSYLGNNTNASANASNLRYPIWGVPAYTVLAPTTLARITGASNSYAEFNIQNSTANAGASTDFVATADNGSETTHYVNFGINSSLGGGAPFANANAGYVYSTDNELDLGAVGATGIVNIYGGVTPTLIASFNQNGNVTIPQFGVAGAVTNSAAGLLSTTPITGTGNLVAQTGATINTPTLSVLDNAFTIKDDLDATKTLQLQLSGITTGTNTVETVPNLAAWTAATTSTLNQTFTGASTTFSGATFITSGATPSIGTSTAASTINIGTGATLNATTKAVNIGTAGVSGSTTNIQIGSAVAGSLGTTTINSPTLAFGATNTAINEKDSALHIQNAADATKQILFDASGITTGTTRTLTSPNASGTLPLLSLAQTWSAAQSFNSSDLVLNGSSSGTTVLNSGAAAGSSVLTLPIATDTLVGKATTDTLTNKTFDTAGTGNVFKINGTQITANTGTGSNVLATSPTLVTPNIGVATATSVNFGGSALSTYVQGSWTPTDGSGAGLVFTSVAGSYTQIGNLVTMTGNVTYPSTANTNAAVISGFPVSCGGSGKDGGVINFSGVSSAAYILLNGGAGPGTTASIYTNVGAAVQNVAMTGSTLYFQVTCHV